MRNIKTYFCSLFLFFSAFAIPVQCQEGAVDAETLQIDSTSIKTRAFSEEKIEEFKADSDFSYGQAPRLKLNLWQKFLQWLQGLLGEYYDTYGSAKWPRVLFYIIIGVIVRYHKIGQG